MSGIVTSIDIPGLPKIASGKVREMFDLGDSLLMVTTDRISAYDVIMTDGIPEKGRVLTALSRFWFLQLRPLAANHYITFDTDYIMGRIADAGGKVDSELRAAIVGMPTPLLLASHP